MGTKSLEGFRRTDNGWVTDPHNVVIDGIDNDEVFPTNPLVHEESNAVTDEELAPLVASIEETSGKGISVEATRMGGAAHIVDGRRRTRALRILNDRRVADGQPPFILGVTFVQVDPARRDLELFKRVVSMNNHRREIGPYERSRQAVAMQGYGASLREIAVALGDVTPAAVSKWLDIAETAPVVQQGIADGSLPAGSAETFKSLPEPQQREIVEEMESDGAKKTAKEIKKRAAEKSGSSKPLRRGKREILKIIEERDVGYEFRLGVRWALGDLTDEEVGL